MFRALLVATAFGACLPTSLLAQAAPVILSSDTPPQEVLTLRFEVPSAGRRYGLLVQAPPAMACTIVRYRIEGGGGPGRVSRGLGAGQMALVRLRDKLPPGPAELRVSALGCAALPDLLRRVTLNRSSPDHSWRAGLTDVEGHPLGQGQGRAIVQRIGSPPHIGLPRIRAAFAPTAGFLFAPKSPADFGTRGADVHIGNAAIAATGRKEGFRLAHVIGEDRG